MTSTDSATRAHPTPNPPIHPATAVTFLNEIRAAALANGCTEEAAYHATHAAWTVIKPRVTRYGITRGGAR